MNSKQVFTNADATSKLIVICADGKSGFNLKATMKGVGKGGPRALTGARHTFSTEREAQAAFDRVCDESKLRGWTPISIRVKNAFVDIPDAPPSTKKGSEAPTKGQQVVVTPRSERKNAPSRA